MKTLGILGGMSWESTQSYYRLINQGVKDALGGLHSAKLLLHSFDFADIERLQAQQDWDSLADMLAEAATGLERAGAQAMLIATNTMHKVAPEVESHLTIPLLHIADAAADELQRNRHKKVALLGTRYTMQLDFYKTRIHDASGIEVITPESAQQEEINRIIYEELCRGELLPSSRDFYYRVIDEVASQGAEGVILGCTEIGLLVRPENCAIPLYDTTDLHCAMAVKWATA
ncbi:amino acid racemase [Hahella sp. KA22]|uniref:aspartate/glutamate racemase family protein n=1 Tax=Hahella sp. KA22 TaxID=1628392 RepID=UPI000FDD34F9|nr:aspartate/glutamate racemase family protein [Hahella sp. KA22]AZZ89982.1 aspartate/glutamate racemase family protein [Hahella sp. KA22]QAY53350.1 amino acid racemase [Hahella sp. KA22]